MIFKKTCCGLENPQRSTNSFVWFLFSTSAWEKTSRCTRLPSVHIVTFTPTRITDLSEIFPSNPNQLKLRRECYWGYFCLGIFKGFPTELSDFTEDHPICKIHSQELVLSPAQLEVHPFVCIGPLRCHYSSCSKNFLLHLNLSCISSPLKKK